MNAPAYPGAAAALLDNARAEPAPPDTIRQLLRDTSLLATTLKASGVPENVTDLRRHCLQLMERFSAALERRGYPPDVREDALIAQCGLLDEIALRCLSGEDRASWAIKPLQVERFNLHDAGERVFERLAQRMRETPPRVDLLECYAVILGLGFAGRHARQGDAKLAELATALGAQLEALRPVSSHAFHADRPGRKLANWLYRRSSWAIAGLTCLALAVAWLGCDAALDARVARLLPAKVVRP
jgi:type VI secretion system protein ImpK